MSKRISVPLQIAWAPGAVRAFDVKTGRVQTAESFAALGQSAHQSRHAIVGVERSRMFIRLLRLPKAAPADMRRLVEAQIAMHFPLPADQLAFDVLQSSDKTAEGCLTLVAAMRNSDLNLLHTQMREAGMRAERVLPISFLSPTAAEQHGMSDAVVVDPTPEGLAIDLVKNGMLIFSRLAPAECDIGSEILRTLAAADSSEMPVLSDPTVEVEDSRRMKAPALSYLLDAHGFNLELPEEHLKAQRRKAASRSRMALTMAGAAIIIATFTWWDISESLSRVQDLQVSLTKATKNLQVEQSTAADRLKRALKAQRVLSGAFEPAQPMSDMMDVVADQLPTGMWLTGMDVQRGKPIQFRGTASRPSQVANLVHQLSGTPRLSDARLVSANTAKIGVIPTVQFSATVVGVGNTPMPTPPKKTKKNTKTAATGDNSATNGTTP